MIKLHRRSHVAISVAASLVFSACSSGYEVADLTTVAPPPATAATPAPDSVVATTAANTTVQATTAPEPTDAAVTTPGDAGNGATAGPTGPMFSDALGTKVETAPGVDTRGDTRQLLAAGLYVHIAWESDPDDPSVFTVQPDDIAILEAYTNAVTTYYRAATTTVTTDDPDFAKYIVDATAMFGAAFDQARAGNFVLDLGAGVVLRPYVVDGGAGQVVVYDCYLQDEVYLERGKQRPPTELTQRGQVVTMEVVDGGWKAATAGSLGSACL